MSEPLTADQVQEWYLFWRCWIHRELVDSLELASGPRKEKLAFSEHDQEIADLLRATEMKLARIELLEVLTSRAKETS